MNAIKCFKDYNIKFDMQNFCPLTLLHTGRPKLYTILAFMSAKGLVGWLVVLGLTAL